MSTRTLYEALEQIPDLPVPVHSWIVEEGEDSTGYDSVWVWAVLPDDDESNWEWDKLERLQTLIWDAVRSRYERAPPWVYVRFRGASESVEA